MYPDGDHHSRGNRVLFLSPQEDVQPQGGEREAEGGAPEVPLPQADDQDPGA